MVFPERSDASNDDDDDDDDDDKRCPSAKRSHSKKDHHLYLVEEEEKRRRKREVSNKIVLFSRERRIDYPHARTRRTGNEEESTARVDVVAVEFRAVFFERFKRRSGDDGVA